MNFIKQKIIPFIASGININTLVSTSKQYTIYPFYHTVTDDYLPHISPLYKPKTIKEFQNDIDFLLKHFSPISAEDVYLSAKGEIKITKPSFHLSFDDGLREVYDIIFPILYQKGIPATVFVNSDFVDNKNLFYRYKAALIIDKINQGISINEVREISKLLMPFDKSKKNITSKILKINYLNCHILDEIASFLGIDFQSYLQNKKPYLSSIELKELHSKGFAIGGHSIDHPLYSLISEDKQIKQTLDSCSFAQKSFNEEYAYFAFPFSDAGIKDSFFSKIFDSVSLTFGISGINAKQNGCHIGRIDMENYARNAEECVKKAYLINIVKGIL